MADAETGARAPGWAALAPLREKTFRSIWSASLLSNFGQLILGVGAAWEMTRLTGSAEMVALVQSALMLPLMLVAVPAGAFADMFDRRKIAMLGLAFSSAGGCLLTALAAGGYTSAWMLLGFCALIGMGVALYAPAWQSSISEQVKPEDLPAAVALGSISYNLARSFGPALGGMIVMAFGATAAFAMNAFFYLPLLLAFFLWKRRHIPGRLPPERIDRAIISGARYAMHAPPIRTVLIRVFAFGFSSSSIVALTPLVARDMLGGDASTFGLLLGASGVGAVGGALLVSPIRSGLSAEAGVRLCMIVAGLAVIPIAFSNSLWLTSLLMLVAGGTNMLLISLFNVGVQLSSPRWVTARALSWFQAAMTGGIALGAWIWGRVASDHGVEMAFIVSGGVLCLLPLLGLLLPMPTVFVSEVQMVELGSEPEVSLAITPRSGPIIIEVEYRVDPARARDFYAAMLAVESTRLRNGGFGWSLSRDIADPELWTERYHCPTWGDYLQQRSRFTEMDRRAQMAAESFNRAPADRRVRRRLERPLGSVRWRAESPDPQRDPLTIFPT